jgi:hypothetical protein
MAYDKPFELKDNGGMLFASKTKTSPMSADYWGEFKLDLSTVDVVDGKVTFKLSGWKKKGASGSTFLSLAVNNWKPDSQKAQPKAEELDDDIEF